MGIKNILLTIFVIGLILVNASISIANEFHVDGHLVNIMWKQKKDEFKAWGGVEKGQRCKQLNISVYFTNSKDSRSAHIEAAMKNYSPNFRNAFEGSDKIYVSSKYSKYWHVDSIYFKCLN